VRSAYGIPGAIAGGALVSRALLAQAPARFSPDLAQAAPVATAWGGYGAILWGVLALALCAAGASYAWALRERPYGPREIALVCALSCAAGFFWLPLFSSDVYAYAAYGELARMGLDPYSHARPAMPNAVIAAADWQWSGLAPVCVYGPAFVALAAVIDALLAHASVLIHVQAFRLAACGALIALVPVAARWRGPRAAAVIALHPLAIWSAIEGHNDVLMLALALAGVTLARTRPAAGLALATLATLVKLPAVSAAAPAARRAPRAAVAAALAIGLGYLPLLIAVRTDLAPHGRYAPQASVQALGPIVAAALAIAVVARIRAFAGSDRWCIAALALWIAIPNPYPWYALWLLPLIVLAEDGRVRAALWIVSAAAALHYLPDAAGSVATPAEWLLALAAFAGYVPLFARAIMTRS
jgi:hypothetical protein